MILNNLKKKITKYIGALVCSDNNNNNDNNIDIPSLWGCCNGCNEQLPSEKN